MMRLSVAALLFATFATHGSAQSVAPPLSQWHHTAWTGSNGPPRGGNFSLARSSDGYLWIGAVRSLLRFDGVRFTVMDTSNTPAFRGSRARGFSNYASEVFSPRFVDRSGVMWVRGPGGSITEYRDGRFTLRRPSVDSGSGGYPRLTGAGVIWIENGRLYRRVDGTRERYPLPATMPDSGLWDFVGDTADGIWVGTFGRGLWHVSRGVARQFGAGQIRPVIHSADGSIWAVGSGVGPQMIGRWTPRGWVPLAAPGDSTPIFATGATQGPDGWVWFSTDDGGVVRWRNGIVEQFSKRHGLSSNDVNDIVVDPEGAAWILTNVGVDRLRPSIFSWLGPAHGIPDGTAHVFAEGPQGSFWGATFSGRFLHRFDGGAFAKESGTARMARYDLSRFAPFNLLMSSRNGGVWLGASNGRLVRANPTGRMFDEIQVGAAGLTEVEMRSGDMVLRSRGRLSRAHNGVITPIRAADGFQPNLTTEDARGRLWFWSNRKSVFVRLENDTVAVELTPPTDVLPAHIVAEGGDTLWISTFKPVVLRIVGNRVDQVRVPSLSGVAAMGAEAAVSSGYLWVVSTGGIARLSLADLHRAADRPADSTIVTATIFDGLDGLATPKTRTSSQKMVVSRDGRVWIATPDGVVVAEPNARFVNNTPPRVHVEEVSVGNTVLAPGDSGAIPPNPDRVDIHFTATTAVLPERVRLQYMLEGADAQWSDAGRQRVASYSRLRPGSYVFRVRAWNENGVPSTDDAVLRFRVAPAWYQAWWFMALGLLAVAGAGSVTAFAWQRRRTHAAAEAARARFDAALDERTRIARELHDTLLQGFTGITLQLDGVRSSLEERADPSAGELSTILQRADATLREVRETVWEMRSPELLDNDLSGALEAEGRRTATRDGVALQHLVTGTPRRLSPAIEATILRVGREALFNSFKHGDPRSVVVQRSYEPRHVVLDVTDDGRGADPSVLTSATAGGHWGIAGMRERAQRAGGTLSVTTAPGGGMRVTATLPAEPIA